LEQYGKEHSIVRFPHYTVCFVMVYDRTLPERRIRDYDNLELKAVLDAAASYLMVSDSGLLCDAYGWRHFPHRAGDTLSHQSQHPGFPGF
ncbi:MAG: hypothetical protein K2M15_07975, partial [Oscillospiraceae bacterium]|nr:hypothetical protein [Oscillospiraceae bacterium]